MKRIMMVMFAAGLTTLAFGTPQFRSMTMTVVRTHGAVASFDLSFGPAADATALYACWGASDAGATTNGWDNVVKIADIAADATSCSVPITAFPKWGDATCQAIRFVMQPGALFDRATKYLQTTDYCKQYIDTGYQLTAADTAEVAWTFTHNSGQGNTLILGTPAFKSEGNGLGGYIIGYLGNNTASAYISETSLGLNARDGTYQAYFTNNGYFPNNTVVVKAKLSASERVIWTNSVDSTGTFSGSFVEVARNDVTYEGSKEVTTNCFLFGWPGQMVNGTIRYTPFSGNNRLTGRIYYFEISRGGTVAANGIPCVKDGVACFYDSARQIFLYDGQKESAFLANSPEADAGVYTEAVTYEATAVPEGEVEILIPESSTVRVQGSVRTVGTGASTVSVRFAYAPADEDLPALASITNGLVTGEEFSVDTMGLTPGVLYRYAYDFINDQGISSPMPYTGTILARATNEWTGASGDWSTPSNWAQNRVPMADDDVIIPAGASVALDAGTPMLHDLTISGTLIVSGWSTKIAASKVTVAEGAVLTCAGDARKDADLSRVWIACTDLTVAKGGAIDVKAKGYQPYPSTTMPTPAITDVCNADSVAGYGPGAVYYRRGASHGGFGGMVRAYTLPRRTMPCGDAEEPVLAGSSGAGSKYNLGTAGGGAVRIDATGVVTVDGTICADAADATVTSATYAGCGAGGSICVFCRTFCGEGGALTANGGSANVALQTVNNAPYFAGGGGRIAIHYDAAAQASADVSGMTFSVAEGWAMKADRNKQDTYFGDADAGTLWFTDDQLPLKSLGSGIWGQLVNTASELDLDSLSLTWGRVRFVKPGVRVNVAGDVIVSGATARLEFGGDTPTNRVFDCDLMTTVPWQFAVGGNLTIAEGARFDARGSWTNGTTDVDGGLVKVGGKLKVATGAALYCWSDVENGGSPRFAVGDFAVEAGGLVSGEKRGFAGGTYDSYMTPRHQPGYGPSAPSNPGWYCQGAGHGGAGGLEGRIDDATHDYGSHVYDDEYVPTLAGSGGAATGWNVAAPGGGVVFVTATNGIDVSGTVTVDGMAAQDGRGGAGSGGTIYLRGKSFPGAATGRLSARGGDAMDTDKYPGQSGAGGGGRIAVWTGCDWNGKVRSSRLTKATTPEGLGETFAYLGAVTAAGGASEKSVAKGTGGSLKDVSCKGEDGTVWFCHFAEPGGMLLLFR